MIQSISTVLLIVIIWESYKLFSNDEKIIDNLKIIKLQIL